MARIPAAWVPRLSQMDSCRAPAESTTSRSRSFIVPSRDSEFHRAESDTRCCNTDLDRTQQLPPSAGGTEHSARSDLERACLSGTVRRSSALGAARCGVRSPASHRHRCPVSRSLRPPGLVDYSSTGQSVPGGAMARTARRCGVSAPPRRPRHYRARLVGKHIRHGTGGDVRARATFLGSYAGPS